MSEERLKRTGEVFLVPFDKIIVDDEVNTGRIEFGDLEELANSIQESTLRVPLLVQKVRGEEQYILIQGKRRFKAIEILINRGVDIPGVKCFLAPQNYNIENSLFDQIVMNDGKPYTALEQGIVFQQLVGRGYSVSDISKKTGKSVTHINNCVEIASLPKKVQNLIASGSVSGLTAVELFKVVKNENELIEKLESAVTNAPEKDGKKKKVTKKNIAQIANISPLKRLDEVKSILEAKGNQSSNYFFLVKLMTLLKKGEDVEKIVELF
jgi:ParB/RepB/Spo0J family partition protein